MKKIILISSFLLAGLANAQESVTIQTRPASTVQQVMNDNLQAKMAEVDYLKSEFTKNSMELNKQKEYLNSLQRDILERQASLAREQQNYNHIQNNSMVKTSTLSDITAASLAKKERDLYALNLELAHDQEKIELAQKELRTSMALYKQKHAELTAWEARLVNKEKALNKFEATLANQDLEMMSRKDSSEGLRQQLAAKERQMQAQMIESNNQKAEIARLQSLLNKAPVTNNFANSSDRLAEINAKEAKLQEDMARFDRMVNNFKTTMAHKNSENVEKSEKVEKTTGTKNSKKKKARNHKKSTSVVTPVVVAPVISPVIVPEPVKPAPVKKAPHVPAVVPEQKAIKPKDIIKEVPKTKEVPVKTLPVQEVKPEVKKEVKVEKKKEEPTKTESKTTNDKAIVESFLTNK
jgi:chromosome segregation ATPase